MWKHFVRGDYGARFAYEGSTVPSGGINMAWSLSCALAKTCFAQLICLVLRNLEILMANQRTKGSNQKNPKKVAEFAVSIRTLLNF